MTTARDLRREIIADLLAVRVHLTTPYTDDPRWTPWDRFVERALRSIEGLAALSENERIRAEAARDGLRHIAHPRWSSPGYARVIAQNVLADTNYAGQPQFYPEDEIQAESMGLRLDSRPESERSTDGDG